MKYFSIIAAIALIAVAQGCSHQSDPRDIPVAEQPTRAVAADGAYISWVEHLVDSDELNGGLAIRGGDGLVTGDIDADGYIDIVSVHEDSHHLRIAFGSADPDRWTNVTIAHGRMVGAIEDVAIGDLNADGWLDLVAACEEAHLVYFQNPGSDARTHRWQYHIPSATRGRGSWLKVDIADLTGDGQNEVVGANKGQADVVRADLGKVASNPTSLFRIVGDPLVDEGWREQELVRDGVPNQARVLDIDNDGKPDVLAASRLDRRILLIRNRGVDQAGVLEASVQTLPIVSAPGLEGHVESNAFDVAFGDINADGRTDLIVHALEFKKPEQGVWSDAVVGWLEQPEAADAPWVFHRIGSILPDWVTGIGLADIDNDGDPDVVVGGYSGLNVLKGGYSGASRDRDDASVDPSSSVARIAWFANPGVPGAEWERFDVMRSVRGMYDVFVARDMDGDGDMDFVATRGNSGEFDGVFWLEQRRSAEPRRAFTAAREHESLPLPLPPADWREHYGKEIYYVAPNKEAQDAALDASKE